MPPYLLQVTDTNLNGTLFKLPWPGLRYPHRVQFHGEGRAAQTGDVQGARPKADPATGLHLRQPIKGQAGTATDIGLHQKISGRPRTTHQVASF